MHRIYAQLNATCAPSAAQWIGVSKKQSPEKINAAYALGLRDFAENYAQELRRKAPQLPQDIRWHFIGHLQKNKVKSILPFIHTIHSVDSVALFRIIAQCAQDMNRKVRLLLQVRLSEDPNKQGIPLTEVPAIIATLLPLQNPCASICGLMGMASLTEDEQRIRQEFQQLKQLFEDCKTKHLQHQPSFNTLSMGMSSDYHIALEEGSTLLRIGSLFFGERPT